MKINLLLLLLNVLLVNCFNFDIKYPIVKKLNSQIDAYFGYSIVQHYVKSEDKYYLIVGAPKDDYYNYKKSGAIYSCPISNYKNDCEQINVRFNASNTDLMSDSKNDANLRDQYKGMIFDDQWFGVSLSASQSGFFTACAHKYTHYYDFTQFDEHATYGACFLFNNNFIQETKFTPCLSYSHIISRFTYNYAYCQAGTSLSMIDATGLVSSDSNSLFISIGMPSALNFRGLVNVKERSRDFYDFIYRNDTSLCAFDPKTGRPLRNQECNKLWPENSYLGMSNVIIPNYSNSSKSHLVISGAPRQTLYGTVNFFIIEYISYKGPVMRQLPKTISGSYQGSYFGSSLGVADVNGDGLKDIIVGAPTFSQKYAPNRGAIYVYLNSIKESIQIEHCFNYTGQVRSQFGTSISSIGDIDFDGIEDFAVGAPFEINSESESQGAVYIFRGSRKNNFKLSQKIFASYFQNDLNSIIIGFGQSLSGGMDMDNNKYPDFAIGAFKSNTVFVIKTYPIINITTHVSNIDSLQSIDQNTQNCMNITNEPCLQLEICFKLNANERNKNLRLPKLNYLLVGDSGRIGSSRVLLNTKTNIVSKSIDIQFSNPLKCEIQDVYLKPNMGDYLTPVKFNISYEFERDLILEDINKHPLTHEDTNNNQFEVNFRKQCGNDNQCVTDLKIEAELLNIDKDLDGQYLVNFKNSEFIDIKIFIENGDEPAYETIIEVKYDERLDFIKYEGLVQYGYSCFSKNKSLICKISSGNSLPFEANQKLSFTLRYDGSKLRRISQNKTFDINILAKTISNDTNLSNNVINIVGKLIVQADLFIYGRNYPEQVFYENKVRGESSMKDFDDIGPLVEHTYIIQNLGPFSIDFFNVIFYWPYELIPNNRYDSNQTYGKYLLYLHKMPTKMPQNHPISVECDKTFEIDPLKLSEMNRRFKRDTLEEPEKISSLKSTAVIDCFSNTAKCYQINCSFYGELITGSYIPLKFSAMLWNSTLAEDYNNIERVLIRSHAKIELNELIYDSKIANNEHTITTIAYSKITKAVRKLPLEYIIPGSILVGIIVLIPIILVLHYLFDCFNFKKKPINEDEKNDENTKLNGSND